MKVWCTFFAILMAVLLPNASSAQFASCQQKRVVEYPTDEAFLNSVLEQFGVAFFKILPEKETDIKKSIGSATLIDPRGLFITAAHVLEEQQDWGASGNSNWVPNDPTEAYPKPLRLLNRVSGESVFVNEVGPHRKDTSQPDVSILRLTAESALDSDNASKAVPVNMQKDLILYNNTPSNEKVAVYGYPVEQENIDSLEPRFIKKLEEMKGELGYIEGIPFSSDQAVNGYSGALAIGTGGLGVGVLKGIKPKDDQTKLEKVKFQGRLYFTMIKSPKVRNLIIASARSTFGPSQRLQKILEEMAAGNLTEPTKFKLFSQGISHLELVMLAHELSSNAKKYQKFSKDETKQIRKLLECSRLWEESFGSYFTANAVQ
jgi:hypothetical protein